MLDEICGEIRNYFIQKVYAGKFTINGGKMPLDFLKDGQYFRISGSIFNDGVYRYPAESLSDEDFVGVIWAMSPPPAFISLCEEINAYESKNSETAAPYISESFGGYSYTKATDADGAIISWQKAFAKRLNKYRRVSIL